jgi:DNA (cytosine-5)-methyltransferase 1
VETALRAKFVKTVTSGTNLDAGAQKTVLQSAIDGGKTLGIASGAYAAATGLSAIEGVPGELKQAAWTAANLYSGYKGGMFVARQLRSASGFAKTVLKEVADPAQGLDVGARMRVAANPDVPDFVRNVLRSPSSFRAMESTPARLAKNQALSPAARAVFGKLSDYRLVQAARLAKDTAAGAPKGMVANVPFVAGAIASDDPERAGQMLAAGGVFGAMGGAAGRFTEARQRSVERAEGDIARLLVDIQAGNELGSGLGGDIMRNRIRPGTQFQDGPGGFVLNPDREVSSFLTEVEMAGGDVSAFVRGKSFDELAQWAAYQGFFRDKVDLVPLNATDFKLNAEANGQNGAGAYFLQPSEGRRARVFVNAESRRNGLAPHEYGHAVLRGGALSPDQIDAVHAEINSRYAPDALRNMAGEYAATMVRAENAKQGINIEPSPAAITAKVNELSQGSMIKGSADGLDWLREEVFAEEFRNANIDMNRARRNIPLGANPVSFFENLLGAQSRALHMAGIDIDPQTGKPMGRDQIFKENRVAAGDPVVMKNYEDYVKQWRRWINDPTHEVDSGVPLSKTGNVRETADSPNVTWKDYGRGRMETEFAVKNPDGSVTPKDWNKEIKPTVRARQQAVREMSNRSKEVAAADDQTFGMRRRRDGRLETSGRRLPDSFFFIPQYKPFHDILRKINAADDIGETLQVRFFAKGKSKDVFKDGIKNTSAVNREALHGNFVAKKDGTLMWGWLDMTQFRNRAMKAIADKNPALAQYDWNLKAIMDDLPVHLTDQRRGKGGAFSVGPERANILNGLIGIGDGPLVGAFGKGTAYKTIHLDSIDAIVPTGKTGGEFDVYRANRNAMPDDPKPPVDMETDIDNNRMPQQIPREAQGMPDAVETLTTDQLQRQYEENQGYLGLSTLGMREGRPVRGGAAQTRELLRRNEAISAELERRGVREEDPQLQRALQRRGQAMPDVADVSTSTSVAALQKHPMFKSAKYDGSAKAAYDIVESLVKPKAIQDVMSKIDPNKPAYIIPVIAREGESANMLPLAMADKLSEATGIPIWNKLAKTSSQHNTGAKADARARTMHRWEGEPPPAGSQIVLVDDTYTTGQTLRSLAAVVGDPDAVATISVGRYTKQFTLQPDREQKLLAKAGLTKQQFNNLYGSEPKQILTGAQAQQYLLNGARGEQGLLARFPVDRGGFSTQGIAGLTQLPEGVTTFSGGGLVEIGLRGIVRPTVAVEYSPAIAQAYRAAHGDHVKVQDIRTVSLEDHKGKFHYHASPVCKNSSLLKSAALGGGEKDLDIESAQAVARHIDQIEPRVVTIENVPDYAKTEAADIIRKKLQERGYTMDENVYNAAKFGAPTARRRYLLRAVKDGVLPEPVPQDGPGWYSTVADMIDTLPDDSIARAQYIYRSLREQGVDPDNVTEPLLVSGTTLFKKVAFARPDQPAFTFKATPATVDRILLPGGRVKRVTARAKARMTGIPDSYPLPKDEKTALTIIGNGVPPALVRNVFGPVIEANK